MIYIIDFGSQVTQLIARRVREQGVYCEIISHKNAYNVISKSNTKGIILSGGPASVHVSNAPKLDKIDEVLDETIAPSFRLLKIFS